MHPLFVRATFGTLLSVGLLGLQANGPSWLEYVWEYGLIASALALAWTGWGHALLTQVPRSARPIALVLPMMLTAGAVIKAPHALYPFVSWGMFGRSPTGELVQYRLFVDDEGVEQRLMPGAEVSDVVASSLDGHLRRTCEAARGSAEAREAAATLLAAIARLHAAAGGSRSLSRLERCATPASSPVRLRCEPVALPRQGL